MKGNFKALIQNRTEFENHNPAGVFLSLPATKEELHEAMEALNITAENPKDFFLNGYVTEDGRHIEIPQEWIREADLDEVNFLAARLEEMPPIEFDKLEAIMHSDLKLGSLEQLIDYTFNMDCFEHIPDVYTRSDLGDYYLNDSGMVQMPEEWKSGIDKEDFGGNAAICENGHFTDHGYIKSTGREWQVHYAEKNIPDQYRIMSFPERESILSDKAPQMQGTDKEIHSTPIELKAQNPAEKVKEITEKLEQGVQDLFESNQFEEYLKVMSKFHNYSVNNLLLISMQNPNATLIAGYNSWKNLFGRQVLKGERGLKILAPSPYKVKREVEKIDPQTGKMVIGRDGKPVTEMKEIQIPAFKVVSVFDVSQTDGKEIPGITDNELTGDVDQYQDFFTALERTSPFSMGFEALEGTVKGRCIYDEQRIAINEGMSELQNLETAIHEIAHATLHNIDRGAPERPDRSTREVQAESIAYTVCQHYGLDTSDYSFNYIAGWSSGRELAELKTSLETIRATAADLINTIDGHLAEIREIRKEREAEKAQEAEKEPTPDLAAEPTVTILWSESSQLQDGETIPFSRANTLIAGLDEANLASPGYDKTAFRIDYVMNGTADYYEGRQDLGDGDGSLVEHIEQYQTDYMNDKEWENYLLQREGKEALEADKEHRAMLLNEFIPYLKLHCNLSEMERTATEAMQSGDNLTPTETAYHTAMQAYVAECRRLINQGEYHLPPTPQLKDFDLELQSYKEHVEEEIAQEAAAAGMTVEEYAANGYEPYSTPEKEAEQTSTLEQPETKVKYYPINEAAARHANSANSFYDYKPGSATAEYRNHVDKAAEIAAKQKKQVDPSFHERIDRLLDAYARKLAANMNKGYEIAGRVPSILIAGGGNFPVHKKEKQNAATDKNMQEYREIQGLLDKIRSTGMGGISADDPNAVSKLESKLAKLEQAQETMKAVNAYYRKNKTLDGCPHLSPEQAETLKASMSGRRGANPTPFESYELSNNNAEIHRIKDRITAITRRKELGYVGWEFDGGRVEANAEDNRLQIFFDEKPDKEIREKLKGNGFRYAPSAGAWQRQLNDNAIYAADRIGCVHPLTGERPTELQKRARQEAAAHNPQLTQETEQAVKPSVLDNLYKKKEQVNSDMNKTDQRTHNREAER